MHFNNEKLHEFFDILIRCIYPKYCDRCGKIIPLNETYCNCFRSAVKISNNYCHHCGREIEDCNCNSPNSAYLPEIAGVYYYMRNVRKDIIDFKFNGKKRLIKKYGMEMADRCSEVYKGIHFDIVTFIPSSKESYKTRGYNQSKILADYVGGMLFVPTRNLFTKTRETKHQHKLSGKERRKNLINSIALINENEIKGKNVLICDDVKTTGSTLSECVSLLEKAGAAKVCCICIAITKFSFKSINISPILVNNNYGDKNELLQR